MWALKVSVRKHMFALNDAESETEKGYYLACMPQHSGSTFEICANNWG